MHEEEFAAVRNFLSDEQQFAAAKKEGTEPAYQSYLATGWRHKAEIEAGRPAVAFADARKAASVTAYRSVLRRFPKAGFEADAGKEIAAIYKASFERFKKQAATSDPTLIPFMEALLATLQTEPNPSLQLRFKRPSADALAKAEAKMKSGVIIVGEIAPVAPHFSNTSADVRERRITAELARAFKTIFPNDVLNVSAPPTLNPRLPVFDIAYDVLPSGKYYSEVENPSSLRRFVGIIVRFDTLLKIAGSDATRQLKFEVLPPDRFTVKTAGTKSKVPLTPDDNSIYVTMADGAFDQLGVKLRTAFFSPTSTAFQQAAR